MPRTCHKAFRQDGFALGRGVIFESVPALERIHQAVTGSDKADDADVVARKERVAQSLETLFGLLLKRADLYKALRGASAFWVVMADEWKIQLDLDPAEIETIANVYIVGRKNFTRKEETALTKLVEQWTTIHDEVTSMVPAVPLTLTMQPAQPSALEAATAGFGNLSLAADWPPKHLNVQELAWINDSHIGWQLPDVLGGKLPFLPTDAKDVPRLPDNETYPSDIKLFLCFAAVARFKPTKSKWAVYMAPIAFMDQDERKDWYVASGSLSKKHATIEEFLDYAKQMIQTEKRSLVLGMLSYWIDRPENFTGFYEEKKKPDQKRDQYWNERCLRYGLGVALRTVPGKQGLQLILYDMDYANLKTHPEEVDTGDEELDELIVSMWEWREAVVELAEKKLKIESIWQGGRKPELLEKKLGIQVRGGDSIAHTCAWVWDTVNEHFPAVDEMDKWEYEDWAFPSEMNKKPEEDKKPEGKKPEGKTPESKKPEQKESDQEEAEQEETKQSDTDYSDYKPDSENSSD